MSENKPWPDIASMISTEEQNNKLYNKAINFFGINAQTRIFIEECAEAIVEVAHYYNRGKGSLDDVASELADVEIMLAQMKIIVNNEAGEDLVGNYKHVKLNRLNTMVG